MRWEPQPKQGHWDRIEQADIRVGDWIGIATTRGAIAGRARVKGDVLLEVDEARTRFPTAPILAIHRLTPTEPDTRDWEDTPLWDDKEPQR